MSEESKKEPQGQETLNQGISLSEEDLNKLSGGAFLGEYVLLIGGVLLLLK